MAPALSIEFDSDKKIWYGGDVISGKVILNNKDKVDITKDIVLVFEGVVKLGVNTRYPNNPPITGYRTSRIDLFSWEMVLCQGPLTLPPGGSGTNHWKFSFVIPRNYNDISSLPTGNAPPVPTELNVSGEQEILLPPSMNESAVAGECIITYTLMASVRSDKFFTKDKETSLRLIVYPQTRSQSTELSLTTQLFQVKAGGGSGLKDKMRFALKPSSQPTVEVRLIMELPSHVVHSVNHGGQLSVEYGPQQSAGVEAPEVYLTWIDITMTQHTSVAVTKHPWTAGKPVASWSGRQAVNKTLQLGTIMKRIMIPESTVPTFNSTQASVSWQWHFHVMFDCGGKKFDFRGDIPCTVLSQPWEGATTVAYNKYGGNNLA